ncbi:MAG: cation transporter [Bacteroidales bacterium]|nr:cation transporter [Bacteroidales bacterium]
MEIYMDREKEIRNVTLWGSVVNLILTTIKIIAGFLGRSGAMVADGVHSFSDLLTDFVVIAFTRVSSKGHDRSHSFGHGKFETMATLVVGLVLIAVGANLMANGVESIVDAIKGEIIPRPRYIALIAAAISIISKEIMYHITVKVGKRTGSQAVIANAWHHRSDALSSIGSFFGIGGAILLGEKWTILDPIAGCCISIAIIVVAIKICIPSLAELLDASLPEDVENEIISNTLSVKGVNDVHGLKTRRSGISFIIVAHIVVNPTLSLVEAHDISTDVENALKRRFGDQTQISIHVEPDINAQ